jgi:hypothetical protein
MQAITGIVLKMRENSRGIPFADLCKVCEHFFGPARMTRGSHRVYKTPWPGDPWVNIQNSNGYAKAYQVKQVLRAIEKLENQNGT